MVLEAISHDYKDYKEEKVSRESVYLRAKMRKIFDAIETYARYLNDLSQQIGIRMKAAMKMYSPLKLHCSYSVSKQIT